MSSSSQIWLRALVITALAFAFYILIPAASVATLMPLLMIAAFGATLRAIWLCGNAYPWESIANNFVRKRILGNMASVSIFASRWFGAAFFLNAFAILFMIGARKCATLAGQIPVFNAFAAALSLWVFLWGITNSGIVARLAKDVKKAIRMENEMKCHSGK